MEKNTLMKWQRVIIIANWLMFIFIVLVVLRVSRRIFIGDWFPVDTTSMVPAIIPGDKIWVNKLIFGARIYKNLDFFEGEPISTFRVKGWRKIRRNDVVVFNAPIQADGKDSIAFKINYIYVKRCMGLPGDTVRNYGHQRFSGAVYVPKKRDTLFMNNPKIDLYRTVILYETNNILPADYHVFLNNYYFMCGDNTWHSHDSRYFGFVPEEFIIGVAKRVLINNRDGWEQRFRGRRILKRLTKK